MHSETREFITGIQINLSATWLQLKAFKFILSALWIPLKQYDLIFPLSISF